MVAEKNEKVKTVEKKGGSKAIRDKDGGNDRDSEKERKTMILGRSEEDVTPSGQRLWQSNLSKFLCPFLLLYYFGPPAIVKELKKKLYWNAINTFLIYYL